MSNLEHVSFDIETLGTKPGSVVLTVGMTAFNLTGEVQTADALLSSSNKIVIDIKDSISKGLSFSGDTLKWWLKRSEEAKEATFFENPQLTVAEACSKIFSFLQVFTPNKGSIKVWGNGANFDITLLESLFDLCDMPYPWEFWNIRCLRTLKETMGYDKILLPPNKLAHDCLADAINQAQLIQLIYKTHPSLKWK